MMYLNRPVFPFEANWRDLPVKAFHYPFNSKLIGFGKARSAPVQDFVVQGFQIGVDLKNEEQIAEFETFTEGLRGMAIGFWFRNPAEAMKVLEWQSASSFAIEDQDLRDTWNKRPDSHLVFVKKGETPRFGQVAGVALNTGREIVTLEQPLAEVLDASWSVHRLHYVRLASDELEATLIGEQRQDINVRVVELPHEYAAEELGLQPIYLYRFWFDTGEEWRFTSFEQSVLSNGMEYLADAISHGDITATTSAENAETTITAFWTEGHPLTFFVPFPVAKRMHVQILRTTVPAPDVTEVLFTGRVMSAPVRGDEITARCAAFLDGYEKKCPAFLIQSQCQYNFGDTRTCRVNLAAHTVAATITKLAGRNIEVSNAAFTGKARDWYAMGRIETGAGATTEIRSILKSGLGAAGKVILTLDLPLIRAEVGQAITVVRGCDGTRERCKAYGNFDNFGGHIVPLHNLSLKAMEQADASIGKK